MVHTGYDESGGGCKCQYKNVVFLSYKHVEKPTRLYDIFNCLQSYIAFGLLVCMKDHLC